MLTYRTGSAGAPTAARNMAEHLLQQTLSPEMAVMADYYEQGVTPPTTAEAAYSRYSRLAVNGLLPGGGALDALVKAEAIRIGESALAPDGAAPDPVELHMRAVAALVGAGLVTREVGMATLARLAGSPNFFRGEGFEQRFDDVITATTTERDDTSAAAIPRRDMNPALAHRLAINTNRGLRAGEVAFLLNGQRADGGEIDGRQQRSATLSLTKIFAIPDDEKPTRAQLEHMLEGKTAAGKALSEKEAVHAVSRLHSALGVKGRGLSAEARGHILSGRMADGRTVSDRAYREALETSASRIGYIDFTFSAPKSLSIAWAFAPTSAERAMLHQAHTDAIESVMQTIEKEIGRARKGDGGKDGYEPGAIGWVSFQHYAARPTVSVVTQDETGQAATELHSLTGTAGRVPGDMQIHTHVAVFNAVETPSGRVGGLDLAQLEGRIHEFGAVYQAFLAENLRRHGVEIALDQSDMARLVSVPESVIAHFSKRTTGGTDAARQYAQSVGLDWDAMDAEHKISLLKSGVQDPRGAKTDDVSDLATWRRSAAEISYQHRSVLRPDASKREQSREERLEAAYQAAMPILEKQFDRRAVIDGSDARTVAAKALIVAGIEAAEEVSAVTRAFRERGVRRRGEEAALVWGTVKGKQGRERVAVTTTLEEREEKALIATARAGARDKSAALTKAQIDAAMRAFPELNFNTEHGRAQRAVMDSLGTGGRVGLAIGVAGSGKSTLLKPLVEAWKQEGRTVHGIALAWRQADDLAEAGIEHRTRAIASFLNAAQRQKLDLNQNTVVVVDEVGLLGTRQLNDILALQKTAGFQLVLIGDPKQMQAVEAGPVIDLLRRGLGKDAVPELSSSVRQKDAEERETVLMFRNGQTAEAMQRKAENGTFRVIPGGYREAIEGIADLWQQRREANKDRETFTVTVSAPTNAEAHDISMAIRERRRAAGNLRPDRKILTATDGTGQRQYSLPLTEGDRVRLFDRLTATFIETGTHGNIGRNGSVLEVAAIRDDGLVLRTNAGRAGFVPWETLQDRNGLVKLAYGEALTTHTSQGSTVSEHIHAMPSGSRMVTAFGAYTSGSRHKEQSFLVTSDGAERAEIAGRRPLGDRRAIGASDVLTNVTRNLSRQDEKETAHSLIDRAANLRRGTIKAFQPTMERMESRKAAGEPASPLTGEIRERRFAKALVERLPSLAERFRRHCESIARAAWQTAALAERLADVARRKRSVSREQEGYWHNVATGTRMTQDRTETRDQIRKPRQRR
ncbi:relaxase domain-containing protein [Acidisoma cellulosilytica]|uniref:Relaxase domain-containing protein n=1 Tax=Acidisoma cellulosilyticum TaxID=2802395 RepID=A0A963Z8C6_9PROT|nr:MobF family relaxase [Acidisoma cellulosilyticum]MCB8883940.1 relaxase domain-containing protein [Acidisoma cellulosilyticum]